MDPMTIMAIANALKSKKAAADAKVKKLQVGLKSGLGMAGSFIQGSSLQGTPDPMMSAVGGGMTGFATGGIPGALMGLVTGGIQGGMARSDYENVLADQRDRHLIDRTFEPEIMEDGGIASAILQTEEGEQIVLPTMEISKVKAKKKHKDMKEDEVTDIVPEGSVVFSDKKTFSPKKHSDEKLTQGISYYDDLETYELDERKVGDILGEDKKMSFADAVAKVKKYYPTIEAKNKIEEETNKSNLSQREPILKFLFNLQNKGKSKGKKEKVEKAEGGWPIEGDMFEDDSIFQPGMTTFYDPKSFDSGSSYQGINEVDVPHGTMELGSVTDPLPILGNNGIQMTNSDLPQALNVPKLTGSGSSTDGADTNSMLQRLREKYSERKDQITERYNKDKGGIKEITGRQNNNNAMQFGSQMLFSGLQSGYQQMPYESTALISDQFKGISPAIIQSQIDNIAANTNSQIKAMADSGASPGEIASYAARAQAAVISGQNQIRMNQNQTNNVNNVNRIGETRRVIQNNNAMMAKQKNALTDFNNKRLSSAGSYVNQYLTNKNSIDVGQFEMNQKADTRYNQAIGAIDKADDQTYIMDYYDKQNNGITAPIMSPTGTNIKTETSTNVAAPTTSTSQFSSPLNNRLTNTNFKSKESPIASLLKGTSTPTIPEGNFPENTKYNVPEDLMKLAQNKTTTKQEVMAAQEMLNKMYPSEKIAVDGIKGNKTIELLNKYINEVNDVRKRGK